MAAADCNPCAAGPNEFILSTSSAASVEETEVHFRVAARLNQIV